MANDSIDRKNDARTIYYEATEKLSTEWIEENALSHDFENGKGCIILKDSVTEIGERAFWGCETLGYIDIPNSVTKIGDYAFKGCEALTSIVIPDSVTEIGKAVFAYCARLKSIEVDPKNPVFDSREVCDAIIETKTDRLIAGCWNTTIPKSVTEIGEYAFDDCRDLSSIVIPDSVKKIGDRAFSECAALESITVDPKNPVFDSRENCNAIIETKTGRLIAGCRSTTIPDSVTEIESFAFNGCEALTSIVIPDSVKKIGYSAFSGCTGLESIVIPDSVTEIGRAAFDGSNGLFVGCYGLTSIIVDENNSKYDSRDNCNAIIETKSGRLIAGCRSTIIPNSVTVIEDRAFENCKALSSIIIPDSVTEIGWGAFNGCEALTSIIIPKSVTIIGGIRGIEDCAFSGCSGLESIVVDPKNPVFDSRDNCNAIIETETDRLIAGCRSTTIPDSVTEIGEYAFYGCKALSSIVIPDSVTEIDNGAFRECAALESITVDPKNPVFDSRENCNAIIETETGRLITGCRSTTIPDSVTEIGNYAFYGCEALTSIVIPDSVTKIGYEAFKNCKKLTSIVIPDSVTEIENDPFKALFATNTKKNSAVTNTIYYESLEKLSTEWIEENALSHDFENGKGCIILKYSVTEIEEFAFWGCETLTSIVIPNSVTEIEDSAFYNCKTLTSIVIPNSVTVIEDHAFENCKALSSIIIPDSVTKIGRGAFNGCEALTSIIIPNSVAEIESGAFLGCSGLESIVVDPKNPVFDSRENCNAIIETETDTLIVGCRSTIIPNSVTEIWEDAFRDCEALTSIVIPDSVTEIGDNAFEGSTELKSIVVDLKNPVFDSRENCNAIIETKTNRLIAGCRNTTIPNSVTEIGEFAFRDCEALTSIVIPKSVTGIRRFAFMGIAGNAFAGCTGLESIRVDPKNPVFDSRENCNAIIETKTNSLIAGCRRTTIPNSVTEIGESAFSGCKALSSIVIPNSVTEIGESAFRGCEALTSIVIPDSVTKIGKSAFESCKSLISIVIPNSVTEIEESAFRGCKALTSIVIPDSVTEIERNAFKGCEALTSIVIPNSVKTIGGFAFSGCDKLPKETKELLRWKHYYDF